MILPRLADPRLHLAAVIIAIHVLGQVAFGFEVSVPQILAAILACAVIEVAWTLRTSGRLVWPASAMLTGSGVALILRVVGTESGDHWSWDGWHLFALVAGAGLLSKYLIRYRGAHLFNPSNLGLVMAFLVLGSSRVEPLDFWWAPFDLWMLAAYLLILVGGLLITARLHLLAMALTFWVVLAGGLGLLAASGHCVTAPWSLNPVCGFDFWWVVVTSPEVLIFLFFMITDPKTSPRGSIARAAFGAAVALAGVLLIAPQTTEFGAKVGLLAGLVLLSPLRGLFDRVLEPGLTVLPSDRGRIRVFSRGAILGSVAVALATLVVVLGAPVRQVAQAAVAPALSEVEIDPATLPTVIVGKDVKSLHSGVAVGDRPAQLALILAQNLAVEGKARLRSDPSLLRSVDHGARLIEMERRIEEDAVADQRVVPNFTFESLRLRVVYPDGAQLGASLGFEATGLMEQVVYDEEGVEQRRQAAPFATTFVLNRAAGERWLIVDAEN